MLFLKRILNKIQKIKKKLKRVFTKKIYYNNSSFKLRANNWITKYRFDTFENKEPETLKWIDNNLRENDVFFDIGANKGDYSILSRQISSQAKIYAFEPVYDTFKYLVSNTKNKGIIAHNFAFGNKVGVSTINLYEKDTLSSMISFQNDYLKKDFKSIEIYVKTGNSFFK